MEHTFRVWATIASRPSSLNNRLTHGKCMAVASAIRLRGIPRTPGWKNDETSGVGFEVNVGVPITLTPLTKLALVENAACSGTEATFNRSVDGEMRAP
jgi:hypothetical protein